MLCPLNFVLLIAAVAFVASTPVPGEQQPAEGPGPSQEYERPEGFDLEAAATGWGYVQPMRYSTGWNGRRAGYNRGWNGGWNGGWNNGGNNGWNGRSYGGGW